MFNKNLEIMKKIKITLLTIALVFGMNIFANNEHVKDGKTIVTEQISELLKTPDVPFEKTIKVSVVFKYTSNNKISIKRIVGGDSEIRGYIHERLNSKVIESDFLKHNHIYTLPLTLVSK